MDRFFFSALIGVALATSLSCRSVTAPEKLDRVVTFQFVSPTHDEFFVASTADRNVIRTARQELAKNPDERELHINGQIDRGQNRNTPWKWHFVDGQWSLTSYSIELCDSWPSYVDENLDEWMEKVGSFCPWESQIVAEIP
jgi:hypothetical protein